jgi:hypothetical protein
MAISLYSRPRIRCFWQIWDANRARGLLKKSHPRGWLFGDTQTQQGLFALPRAHIPLFTVRAFQFRFSYHNEASLTQPPEMIPFGIKNSTAIRTGKGLLDILHVSLAATIQPDDIHNHIWDVNDPQQYPEHHECSLLILLHFRPCRIDTTHLHISAVFFQSAILSISLSSSSVK